MKKTIKSVLLVVVLFAGSLVLSGCSGSSGTLQGTAPEKVGTASDTSNNSKAKQNQKFKIGDSVKLGDYVVSVTKVKVPFKAKNSFLAPKAGNILVAVEVLYENNTTDKTINYNMFDWKLFDDQAYSYQTGMNDNEEPKLSSGTINPGGKARGWVTFEVPKTSNNFKMQFIPSFISNENIEIQLY